MGVSVDLERGEQREATNLSTQGEGTPSISLSAPISNLEPIVVFSLALYLSNIAAAIGMTLVSCDFL